MSNNQSSDRDNFYQEWAQNTMLVTGGFTPYIDARDTTACPYHEQYCHGVYTSTLTQRSREDVPKGPRPE